MSVFNRLVENKRFELLAPCVQSRCSPNWANSPCLACLFRPLLRHCSLARQLRTQVRAFLARSRSSYWTENPAQYALLSVHYFVSAYLFVSYVHGYVPSSFVRVPRTERKLLRNISFGLSFEILLHRFSSLWWDSDQCFLVFSIWNCSKSPVL